jgi:hypothetical protein
LDLPNKFFESPVFKEAFYMEKQFTIQKNNSLKKHEKRKQLTAFKISMG